MNEENKIEKMENEKRIELALKIAGYAARHPEHEKTILWLLENQKTVEMTLNDVSDLVKAFKQGFKEGYRYGYNRKEKEIEKKMQES